jgi:hypothetical protein
MYHQDGRCASSTETIIVNGGSLPSADKLSGKLVVVEGTVGGASWTFANTMRQVSIVGKGTGATVSAGGGSTALLASGGDVYVRNVSITTSSMGNGVSAVNSAKITLDHVTVAYNVTGLYCATGTTVTASALSAEHELADGTLSNGTPISGCAGVSSCGPPSATCGAQ